MFRRSISYARGAWGGHTRDATVFYHPKEIIYELPLYCERRDLGALKSVKTEDHRIIVTYQRDTEQVTPVKKEELFVIDQPLQTPNQNF